MISSFISYNPSTGESDSLSSGGVFDPVSVHSTFIGNVEYFQDLRVDLSKLVAFPNDGHCALYALYYTECSRATIKHFLTHLPSLKHMRHALERVYQRYGYMDQLTGAKLEERSVSYLYSVSNEYPLECLLDAGVFVYGYDGLWANLPLDKLPKLLVIGSHVYWNPCSRVTLDDESNAEVLNFLVEVKGLQLGSSLAIYEPNPWGEFYTLFRDWCIYLGPNFFILCTAILAFLSRLELFIYVICWLRDGLLRLISICRLIVLFVLVKFLLCCWFTGVHFWSFGKAIGNGRNGYKPSKTHEHEWAPYKVGKKRHEYSIVSEPYTEVYGKVSDPNWVVYWMPAEGWCGYMVALFYRFVSDHYSADPLRGFDVYRLYEYIDEYSQGHNVAEYMQEFEDPFYILLNDWLKFLNLSPVTVSGGGTSPVLGYEDLLGLFKNLNVPLASNGKPGVVFTLLDDGLVHCGFKTRWEKPKSYKMPTAWCTRDLLKHFKVENKTFSTHIQNVRKLTGVEDKYVEMGELESYLLLNSISYAFYTQQSPKAPVIKGNSNCNHLNAMVVGLLDLEAEHWVPYVEKEEMREERKFSTQNTNVNDFRTDVVEFAQTFGFNVLPLNATPNGWITFHYEGHNRTIRLDNGEKFYVADNALCHTRKSFDKYPLYSTDVNNDLRDAQGVNYRLVDSFKCGPIVVGFRRPAARTVEDVKFFGGLVSVNLDREFCPSKKHQDMLNEWVLLSGNLDKVRTNIADAVRACQLYTSANTNVVPDASWVAERLILCSEVNHKVNREYDSVVKHDYIRYAIHKYQEMVVDRLLEFKRELYDLTPRSPNVLLYIILLIMSPFYVVVHILYPIVYYYNIIIMSLLWHISFPLFLMGSVLFIILIILILCIFILLIVGPYYWCYVYLYKRYIANNYSYGKLINKLSADQVKGVLGLRDVFSVVLYKAQAYWYGEKCSVNQMLRNLTQVPHPNKKVSVSNKVPEEYVKFLGGYAPLSELAGQQAFLNRAVRPDATPSNNYVNYMYNFKDNINIVANEIKSLLLSVKIPSFTDYMNDLLPKKRDSYLKGYQDF